MHLTALGLGSGTAAAITYAVSDGGGDPISILTGLGPVGVVALLLIFGKLRTEAEVKGLQQRLEVKDEIIAKKDKQIEALTQGYVDKAMPTLTRLAVALERIDERQTRNGAS
jgi:hypothetical protein